MKDVKGDIKRLKNVATIPVVMQRIMEALSRDDTSYIELSNLISHDQSTAERVVAVANAPYFGHPGMVNSIEQAILLLGIDMVKSIAVSMAVFEMLSRGETRDMKNFWAHAYEVAIISGILCEKVPVTASGVCFLAGLLHDIGRVIFYTLYRKEYTEFMFKERLTEFEQERFGADHTDAGLWFLEQIMIPEEIVQGVRHHHDPSPAEKHQGIATTVYLAEGIASMVSSRKGVDSVWDDNYQTVFQKAGLDDSVLEEIRSILTEEARMIESFFGL